MDAFFFSEPPMSFLIFKVGAGRQGRSVLLWSRAPSLVVGFISPPTAHFRFFFPYDISPIHHPISFLCYSNLALLSGFFSRLSQPLRFLHWSFYLTKFLARFSPFIIALFLSIPPTVVPCFSPPSLKRTKVCPLHAIFLDGFF